MAERVDSGGPSAAGNYTAGAMRRLAPSALAAASLLASSALALVHCVGAEPPIPAEGTDASGDGPTLDGTMGDTATPDGAGDGSNPGDGGTDAPGEGSTKEGGTKEGGAKDATPDGPAYSGPLITPVVDIVFGPESYYHSPAIAVGGGTILVTFDSYVGSAVGNIDGWSVSTNGGKSFVTSSYFPIADGGPLDQGYSSVGLDSVGGNFYVTANGVTPPNYNGSTLAYTVSTNGGKNFADITNRASGIASTDYVDESSVAVDNAKGNGQGFVYVAYGRYISATDIQLTVRDTSGAFSYYPAVSPPSGDQASLPWATVGPNHFLYVVYYGVKSMNPFIGFTSSRNQGTSFSTPVTISNLHVPFMAGVYNGDLNLSATNIFDGGAAAVDLYPSPQIAANPVTGDLYVAYVDSTSGADKANIYFSMSTDGGTTWSKPLQVNDDKTTNAQFLPALAVSPDGKRLAIDFYDRRNDAKDVLADRYAATATISGSVVTFDPNVRLTPKTFAILTEPNGSDPTRGYFSIHTGMAADATYFYDVFSQPEGSNLGVYLYRYGVDY